MSIVSMPIKRVFSGGRVEDVIDIIAIEFSVEIYLNGVKKIVLETSPNMLEELGVGYASVCGYNVDSVGVAGSRINVYGLGPIKPRELSSNIRVSIGSIFRAIHNVFSMAKLFRETGCFHVAALATRDGSVVELVEDISRHCALYKLIGKLIKRSSNTDDKIVVMSSRATSHLIESIAVLKTPIAVFRGAPTDKAIERAKELSITLVAHTRGDRFNIYTHSHRIVVEPHDISHINTS